MPQSKPRLYRWPIAAIFAIFILLPLTSAAQRSPNFAWQKGQLWSVQMGAGIGQRYNWHYEIVTDQYSYEASIWVTGNGLNVTQGGTIEFSFTPSGFYIKDDDGKLHKMTFERKTLR